MVYIGDLGSRDEAGRPRYGVLRGEVLLSNPYDTLVRLDDGKCISVPTVDTHTHRDQAESVVLRALTDRRNALESELLITGRAPLELGSERDALDTYLRREALPADADPAQRRAAREREMERDLFRDPYDLRV